MKKPAKRKLRKAQKDRDEFWWNYRVIRKKGPHGVSFGIHEVYYRRDARIVGIVEDPQPAYGETLEELKSDLKGMLWAVRQPVLLREKICFAPYLTEPEEREMHTLEETRKLLE